MNRFSTRAVLSIALMIFLGATTAQAQSKRSPRLQPPVVIPAGISGSTRTPQQQPEQERETPKATPQIRTAVVTRTPVVESPAASTYDVWGDDQFTLASAVGENNEKNQRKNERDAVYSEMIRRMEISVEQIAAEYGNPTFAHIFTNDTLRARIMKKRVHMLQQADKINAEISALERERAAMEQEVTKTRQQLIALQEEARGLSRDIQRTRVALDRQTQALSKHLLKTGRMQDGEAAIYDERKAEVQ